MKETVAISIPIERNRASFGTMAHIFLNIMISQLRQDKSFKHISFAGNRFLPAVVKSHFTYFTYPIFKDVSGLTIDKCAFKHAVSNVVNVQQQDWEYDREL